MSFVVRDKAVRQVTADVGVVRLACLRIAAKAGGTPAEVQCAAEAYWAFIKNTPYDKSDENVSSAEWRALVADLPRCLIFSLLPGAFFLLLAYLMSAA